MTTSLLTHTAAKFNFWVLILCLIAVGVEASQTVLITGGAGFLGSHLCEHFIEKGDTVICSDNLFTGKVRNIQHLLEHPNFIFMLHDNVDPFDESLQVDQIYNMACPASPIHYQKSPVTTLKTCVLGSINVLELAKRCGAKVFQASTSEIYGDPLEHPQTESYWGNVNPIGIRSCYDEGKRCAETLFFDYHREFGVRIKVARIFNTYGPGMSPDDGRVVSNLVCQALEGKPLTLYGTGEQTRSFCYVSDLIKGIVTLMETEDSFTGPVNLGNLEEFTMLELAATIKRLTASDSTIVLKPLPLDDPKVRKPDLALAKEKLDFEPTVHLEEGLRYTIDYFKSLNE